MDPKKISMTQFKAELKRRGLPTSGTKKDLIACLEQDDPSGEWLNDIMRTEISGTVSEKTASDEDGAVGTDGDEEKDDEERTEERARDRHTQENRNRSGSARSQASADASQRDDDPSIEDLEHRYRDMQLEFQQRKN